MVYSSLLILSSVLLLLACFPPFNSYGFAYVALIPFIWLLDHIRREPTDKRVRKALFAGLSFGFLYMGATHLWIFQVLDFSTLPQLLALFVFVSLYLSLFYGLAALIFCRYTSSIWTFPFIWVAVEWARSIGQFGDPNGVLGYTQALNPVLLPYASVGGVSLLSFLLVSLNCFFYMLLLSLKHKEANRKGFIIALLFSFVMFISPSFFNWGLDIHKKVLSVAIIQGNHSQKTKLDPKNRSLIRQEYSRLSLEAKKAYNPDLFLWPETFSTGYNSQSFSFMAQLLSLDSTVLYGSARSDKPNIYNSALLYDGANQIGVYDKVSLMPFGEYWPYKSLFRFLGLSNIVTSIEFSAGQSYHPLAWRDYNIGVGICLESLYPSHFQALSQNGADFFVVLSNGAWFGDSTIIERHFLMSLFRAVENGRYLFQSSNTGVSAIVSPEGRIIARSELNTEAILTEESAIYTLRTPYKRIGDSVGYFCLGFFLLLCLKAIVHRIQRQS